MRFCEQQNKEENMRTGLKVVKVFLVALVAGALFAPSAMAAFPEKAITMYCVFSPGGSLDSSARALSTEAEKILGQPIVIVTKDGGGGTVGLSVLAEDKPDGYTLAAATSTGIMRIPLARKVTYKPLVSFTPIYAYASPPTGLMVKPDSPFKTLKAMVEHARKNPGQVKYSTAGAGTPMHLIMEVIGMKEKIKWVHVPFKGSAPAETAVLGGHVDAVSTGDMNMAISGQIRPLVMYTKDRYSRFPDAPTTVELGYNYYNDTLFSIFGPAGMDPVVVKKLEGAIEKALDGGAWAKLVETFGLVTVKMKSGEYKKFLEEAWDREAQIQKDLGLITEPATAPK
jgi:tripartite-type tricarboxylate transporter receptor subunit TctC